MYLEVVRSVFMSSTSASGTGRKRTIKDLQEEVSNLYNNIRLFEKGMKYFAGILSCNDSVLSFLIRFCILYIKSSVILVILQGSQL